MTRAADDSLRQVDAVVVVIEALHFGPDDKKILTLLPKDAPVVVAVSKVDLVKDKARLLPFLQTVSAAFPFRAIVPLSAKTGRKTEELLRELRVLLPEGPPLYGLMMSPIGAKDFSLRNCAKSCFGCLARNCLSAAVEIEDDSKPRAICAELPPRS
jgi:GTPase Era involved in 16S rRNA processing